MALLLKFRKTAICFFAVFLISYTNKNYILFAQQVKLDSTWVDTTTIAKGLDIPWEIIIGPDDYLWVTERYGRVSRINIETGQQHILVEINDVYQQQESGLLGMALHPNFSIAPYVYVVYTYRENKTMYEKLVRYEYLDEKLVNPYILIKNIPAFRIHDGSRLLFLPDTTLLMSTGDAGNQDAAQDINSFSGKILRINPDGSVPVDNPFGNYIWSFGHRNVQGIAMSPSGKIYASEHGPDSDDEINIIEKGRNYGWPNVKGFCDTPSEIDFCINQNVKEPILTWSPTIAPSGIIIYNDPAIPEWRNSILMAVLKEKQLTQLILNEDGSAIIAEKVYFKNVFGRLRAICTGNDGSIYIATNGEEYTNTTPFTHKIIRVRNKVSLINWNNDSSISNFISYDDSIKLHLKFSPKLLGANMRIIDAGGKTLLMGKIINEEMLIDKSVFSPGIYIVQIIQNNNSVSQEIIIHR